jgi:hypothetical protein
MAKERTQPTQPKRGDPIEIPVPTRGEIDRALERVARPAAERRSGRRKRRPKQ